MNEIGLKPEEQELLELLRRNAREPTSALARKLGVARSTVQSWIERLERQGIIAGYTVRLGDSIRRRRVRAMLMMITDPDRTRQVVAAVARFDGVRRLHTISGPFDIIAELEAETTEAIDDWIDAIRELDGVKSTTTSVILATRVDR